jgi:hypothetical protein
LIWSYEKEYDCESKQPRISGHPIERASQSTSKEEEKAEQEAKEHGECSDVGSGYIHVSVS